MYANHRQHRGDTIVGLLTAAERHARRFPALAYRAETQNGSLVLCDRHLDLLRAREPARLTGETFAAELCDHCEDDLERGRR